MATKSKSLTLAAVGILKRFQAVEREAERIAAGQNSTQLVQALLNDDGLHAIISDGRATIEIANGQVAVSVKGESGE
jgi:hypothetical protein